MSLKRERWKQGFWLVYRDVSGKRIAWGKWHAKREKRDKVQQQIQERVARRIEDRRIMSATERRQDAEQAFSKYIEKTRKYPQIREMLARFRNTKGYVSRMQDFATRDQGRVLEAYRRMLRETTDEDSEELLNTLKTKRAREVLMKKRISVQISLSSEEGLLAVIDAYGVLLEHSNGITEFWIGRVVESNNIQGQAAEFQEHIGANSVKASVTGKRGMVSKVSTEWKFA